jgi:hypothetical protein
MLRVPSDSWGDEFSPDSAYIALVFRGFSHFQPRLALILRPRTMSFGRAKNFL